MVSRDARRDGTGNPPQEAQQALNALTQELKNLQQDVVVQLARDVARLQSEKARLVGEIKALHDRQPPFPKDLFPDGTLEADRPSLDDARQHWVEHLAKSIAERLQTELSSPVEDTPSADTPAISSDTDPNAPLERSLSRSYRHLEADLADRRSVLSQQLRRMENLQQQGEAILTALIDRMSQNLQTHAEEVLEPSQTGNARTIPPATPSPIDLPLTFVPSSSSVESPFPPFGKTRSAASIRKGLLWALLSTAALALFYLSLKVMFQETILWGYPQWENWTGILNPSWGNVLLISFLRLAMVMLLLPPIALWLYPSFWQDLRQFAAPTNRPVQWNVLGSGICLFASQILLYKAIALLPTAVAMSLFFIYPVLALLGSWLMFRQRPTPTRWAIGAIVVLGCLFCLPNWGTPESDFTYGILMAIASGATFTGYVLQAQRCGKRLHPIPLSFTNFVISFILSGIGVLLVAANAGGNLEVPSGREWTLMSWGVGLGGLSVLSYLFNTLAIRYAGTTFSSLVGATLPMLAALLGWFVANEMLHNHQIFGIVLVTIGAIGLSLHRLFHR